MEPGIVAQLGMEGGRQGPVLVAAFHPELGDDPRLHELFLSEVV